MEVTIAIGMERAEIRDAAKHATVFSQTLNTKNQPAPNVTSAEAVECCSRAIKITQHKYLLSFHSLYLVHFTCKYESINYKPPSSNEISLVYGKTISSDVSSYIS